jgi:hypothetical protein
MNAARIVSILVFDLHNLFVGGYQLGIHGDLKPEAVNAIRSVDHIGLE